MPTAEHCRAMAEEADRLAAIVSYGRDKVRLSEQAACWRARALQLEAATAVCAPASKPAGRFGWLKRRCG